MAIDEVRLPIDIERGARGGPAYKTSVVVMGSGREQRNKNWDQARNKWDIGFGIQDLDDLMEVVTFFRAREGMSRGFLFKDWSDYRATQDLIGVGDGVAVEYQLARYYGSGVAVHLRTITRPITSTVLVYVNGVLKTLTTDYTLSSSGLITFVVAPPNTHEVRATFEFDVPVRFDTDELAIDLETYDAGAIPSIPVIEVRE